MRLRRGSYTIAARARPAISCKRRAGGEAGGGGGGGVPPPPSRVSFSFPAGPTVRHTVGRTSDACGSGSRRLVPLRSAPRSGRRKKAISSNHCPPKSPRGLRKLQIPRTSFLVTLPSLGDSFSSRLMASRCVSQARPLPILGSYPDVFLTPASESVSGRNSSFTPAAQSSSSSSPFNNADSIRGVNSAPETLGPFAAP